MPFIPMPMPKPVCKTPLNSMWVQYEVRITFLGRGMGMNITAQVKAARNAATRAGVQRQDIVRIFALHSSGGAAAAAAAAAAAVMLEWQA